MDRADEVAQLRTEDALHGPFVGRHHMDLDVAGTQGGRDFEPDKARAHNDCPARLLGTFDDGPAVGERAQSADMRLVCARDRQADRLRAGREEQPVIGEIAPVGERDVARTRIDPGDVDFETQIDAVLRIELSGGSGTQSASACRRGNPWKGSADRLARRHRRLA